MKTTALLTSLVVAFWATLVSAQGQGLGLGQQGVGQGQGQGAENGAAFQNIECNFENILFMCGSLTVGSIDDSVYGVRKLREYETNVINPVQAFWNKLQSGNPNVEGVDNPDVAISYAFMHYVCFDPIIAAGEEHKVYTCMREFCPRVENIEQWCEGMNT